MSNANPYPRYLSWLPKTLLVFGMIFGFLFSLASGAMFRTGSYYWASFFLYMGVYTLTMTPYGYRQLLASKRGVKKSGWTRFLTEWYGVFGFLWALPITLTMFIVHVGPMWGLRQYKFYNRYGWTFEWVTVPGSWIERKFWKKWAGVNSGGLTVYRYDHRDVEDLQDHERRHAWQTFTFGLYHVIGYSINFLVNLVRLKDTRKAYKNLLVEVGARRAEVLDDRP